MLLYYISLFIVCHRECIFLLYVVCFTEIHISELRTALPPCLDGVESVDGAEML